MPIDLKTIDPAGKFRPDSSVLFVVCGVCPRMCLATEKKEPYFSIGQLFEKRDYFGRFIDDMRAVLERENIRTAVFKSPFFRSMMCLWPETVRNHLRNGLPGYDAVAVIGCRSAAATVEDAVGSSPAGIVRLSEELGIANFKTSVRFPFRVEVIR